MKFIRKKDISLLIWYPALSSHIICHLNLKDATTVLMQIINVTKYLWQLLMACLKFILQQHLEFIVTNAVAMCYRNAVSCARLEHRSVFLQDFIWLVIGFHIFYCIRTLLIKLLVECSHNNSNNDIFISYPQSK